jgi:Protein of unknown function (DUF4199)
MKKIVLTFGLIAGGIMSAMLLLALPFQDQLGFERGAILGYTTMVVAFLMVYFGIRSYRDTVSEGQITFGRAFTVGLMITLVATVCYVTTWEFIYFNLAPDFGEKMAAAALAKAKASGATEAAIAEQTRQMAEFVESYKNPLVNIAYTFLEPLPVGLLFTLVAAGLLSRKRDRQAASVNSASTATSRAS